MTYCFLCFLFKIHPQIIWMNGVKTHRGQETFPSIQYNAVNIVGIDCHCVCFSERTFLTEVMEIMTKLCSALQKDIPTIQELQRLMSNITPIE